MTTESKSVTATKSSPLLAVQNLRVVFPLHDGVVTALHDVSFTVARGERVGIVGESGAGKSVCAFAIINLLSKPGYLAAGQILFDGLDLAQLDEAALRSIRGHKISMIFQDPMMTLNPVLTIGVQMEETVLAHQAVSRAQARTMAVDTLQAVQIPSPQTRLSQYPHELSGGMRQRVVIAIALLTNPQLIIADEPTTALDVTIQAEILDRLQTLCTDYQVGLILITHDLGVVAQVTERILVMYAGRIIEQGPTAAVIAHPKHPYTRGLIDALPEKTRAGQPLKQIPGVMPSLHAIPSGCPFHPRCHQATEPCHQTRPLEQTIAAHGVRCHTPL